MEDEEEGEVVRVVGVGEEKTRAAATFIYRDEAEESPRFSWKF